MSEETHRLVDVVLAEGAFGRTTANVEHELKVAIFDLLEENEFSVIGHEDRGPYVLRLGAAENRIEMQVTDQNGQDVQSFLLSVTPMRKIIKDYFLICESYFEAIKSAPPSRIEAIDMGRRGLHDEGSRILAERLEGKIQTDFATARRLFTLICVLQWKG